MGSAPAAFTPVRPKSRLYWRSGGATRHTLLRFEVDTRACHPVALGALGTRTDDGGWAAPWQERSAQIGAQIDHLREDLLTAYDG